MDHSTIQMLSGTAGLIIFVSLFLGVLTYALWPKNKDKFARAARLPLDDAQDLKPDTGGDNGER